MTAADYLTLAILAALSLVPLAIVTDSILRRWS